MSLGKWLRNRRRHQNNGTSHSDGPMLDLMRMDRRASIAERVVKEQEHPHASSFSLRASEALQAQEFSQRNLLGRMPNATCC